MNFETRFQEGNWLHSHAVECIGRKTIGKQLKLPGGETAGVLASVPKTELTITDSRMSRTRRADAALRLDVVCRRRCFKYERVVIEVTLKSGKNAEFVNDMAAIGASVVEFDLSSALREMDGKLEWGMRLGQWYLPRTRNNENAVSRWVNSGSRGKRWLHCAPRMRVVLENWRKGQPRTTTRSPVASYRARHAKQCVPVEAP